MPKSDNPSRELFASCPRGLENLLLQELQGLGVSDTRETVAGVYFVASEESVYRVCLWTRLANKILLPLCHAKLQDEKDLYKLSSEYAWEEHFYSGASLRVDFSGSNDFIRHTNYGAQLVKDGIVDRLREAQGERPSVSKTDPDLIINARLSKGKMNISLDLSGESLHKRGYRRVQGEAPLKENLAAALLIRAGWPEIASKGGALIDPMCGSGTLLIEGAMMAAQIAPGLQRDKFGFHGWKQFKVDIYQKLKAEALDLEAKGLAAGLPEIRGYDHDISVIYKAEENIRLAGLEGKVRVSKKSIREFKKPTHKEINNGLVICNPPYGERLGEVEVLRQTYRQLAESLKADFSGWQFAVFTGNPELGKEMRLRSSKRFKFFNGTIASELLLYQILSAEEATLRKSNAEDLEGEEDAYKNKRPLHSRPLSEGAQMVANRIKKNVKRLKSWKNKEHIQCYRVYDADLPEYAAAIDVYDDKLHIQEYAPPASVNEHKAKNRFNELVHAASVAFGTEDTGLFKKERRRNKGKQQYEKLHRGAPATSNFFEVREGRAKYRVNLQDYLDTGLFLDHRPLRKMIAEQSKGKKFLNLFCYTASATVQAALGGASSSLSVDMSNTYLEWAAKNLALNNIHQQRHILQRADCMTWLDSCREGFDLIMLDPPSFSNSKKMDTVLDIQKDQIKLIDRCMDILLPGGSLYFSNNFRKFKLDPVLSERYQVTNILQESLDPDFANNTKIHHCWQIKHKVALDNAD